MTSDWAQRADRLSAEAAGSGEPTAWFDRLYAEATAGEISMPWDRLDAQPMLRGWAEETGLDGAGKRAVVVGCGLGADVAYLAGLGFDAIGFDLSPHAIAEARRRHPGVDLHVADLRDLPAEWAGSFDLVVEIFTLQAVPEPVRTALVPGVRSLVAPGGTLLTVAFRYDGTAPADVGPPFPLARDFMEGLGGDVLSLERLEELDGPYWRGVHRRLSGEDPP